VRAIILAAGRGRRLGDSVTEHPKCLLRLEGRTLLDRMLDTLSALGVLDVVIVVGHLGEQIEAAVAGHPGVRCIRNPEYRRGAILSLWTARDYLDTDVLVMDADVLFPRELLRRLVQSPQASCFLMDGGAENNGEAMMLMARGGRVWDIQRGVRGEWEAWGESVGFLKLDPTAAKRLRELLAAAVARGETEVEHETLYPALMQECPLGYERVDDLPWLEIDFPEDVERARELLPRLEAAPAREARP